MSVENFQSLETCSPATKPPPRALFCVASFFPHPTGATYSAFRLARALREKGVAISFVVEDFGPDWRTGGTYDGFPVRSFPLHAPGKLNKLRTLARFTRHVRALRRDFDLFHIHGGGHVHLFLSWWVWLVTGKPVLMKITSDGWDTPDGVAAGKWGALLLRFYRRLAAVVAMTSGQASKCHAWNVPGRLVIIPNGVDCTRFCPASPAEKIRLRDELQIPRDAFVLVCCGWIGRGKGTDILIETFERLRSRHPNIFLLLVGDYMVGRTTMPDEQKLVVPALPRLYIVGHVDDPERYLRASDILVFPSRQEGFGTVQIESMACGLPCVVNDLPGVSSDIFPDETCGFRISGNSIEDFAAKIDLLRTNTALRETMGHAARDRSVQHFSIESVATRYLAFYHEILHGNRTA